MSQFIHPIAEPLEGRRLFTTAFAAGVISGSVFTDANANAKRDAGEVVVAGRKIYLDANNNGKLDTNEKSATTSSTGAYSFTKLPAATYVIREVTPAGRTVTTPAAGYFKIAISKTSPTRTAVFGEKILQPTQDLSGQYIENYNGTLIEFDLRHPSTSKTSYTGDLVSGGVDLKAVGTLSYTNMLTGTVKDTTGVNQTYTAKLSGKTLTVVVNGQKSLLTQVSTTPAPAPPALVARRGSIFSYKAPAGWKVSESSSGIVINSTDGTQQVAILAGFNNGVFGTGSVVQSELNAGATALYRAGLANGYIGTGLYLQKEVDLITFKRGTVLYAAAQVITTLTNYYGGTYNFNTGTYSGATLTLIDMITAPASKYIAESPTLGNILGSIKTLASAAAAATTQSLASALATPKIQIAPQPQLYYGGYYDPGVYGNWSYSGGFDYSSNPWLYYEQSYMASSSTSFDASCAAFDDYLLS